MYRIFVSTFARYNAGNIAGSWIDLSDYVDADDANRVARRVIGVSDDTELMFPDFEGFPKALYSESSISDELMDWVHFGHPAKEAYVELHGTWSADDCADRYVGSFESHRDFAWGMLEQLGDFEQIPAHLQSYFDIDSFARDLMFDYSEHGGHYFMP